MDHMEWMLVDRVSGQLQAEILRGLLEAQDIRVWLNQEGAGRAFGMGVGPMGEVEILVPPAAYEQARMLLDEYYAGELEVQDDAEELDDQNAEERLDETGDTD